VNLITGKNNAGKSSLLEVVRILTSGGSVRTLSDILIYRDELSTGVDAERTWQPTEWAPPCNLFTGFPNLGANGSAFEVSAEGDLPRSIASVRASIGWFNRRVDPDKQSVSFEPAGADLFGDVDAFPALEFDIAGRRRIVPFDRFLRRVTQRLEPDAPPIPCIYLDPFSSRSTGQMGELWDAVALTDVEPEIVRALTIVSPDIKAVSVVGTRARTVIAKSSAHETPIPLRTFGDGVNRLFGIILSLCNARGGILLVDEIENGLHYSAQTEVWRTIFRLSSALKVQVFATSHSWDCVQAFQEAASESPLDGVLIRLTRRGGEVYPTTFSESELAIATRDQIEVR
jgi:hypothetical protein